MSRRSKAGIIVLFALLLVSVAAAVLYYSPLFKDNNSTEIIQISNSTVSPVIIERNYEIPVTYPYDKTSDAAVFAFDPISIKKDTVIQAQNNSQIVKEGSIRENISAIKTDSENENLPKGNVLKGQPVKIKENIFRYDDMFVVQVSSWKSKQKADSEVERFKGMGKIAFLEEASLPGKGTYYRVRVGNFITLQEAEDFLMKNI